MFNRTERTLAIVLGIILAVIVYCLRKRHIHSTPSAEEDQDHLIEQFAEETASTANETR
jgi:hypothetical protein